MAFGVKDWAQSRGGKAQLLKPRMMDLHRKAIVARTPLAWDQAISYMEQVMRAAKSERDTALVSFVEGLLREARSKRNQAAKR